jgi:hypothetical protein
VTGLAVTTSGCRLIPALTRTYTGHYKDFKRTLILS